MGNSGNDVGKTILFVIIWLSCGFVNLLINRLLSSANNVIFIFLYFAAPGISLTLSSVWMQLGDTWKLLRNKDGIVSERDTKVPKKYGRSVIRITIFIFSIVGIITGFWAESFLYQLVLSIILGIAWGIVWYQLFQKRYMHHEQF